MNIATIYTLYGRRAGAELCFEKIIESTINYKINWIIFCNKQAKDILEKNYPFAKAVYIPYLDNQYKKAFWLEFLSQKAINHISIDCFWIPSGCNHFPGHWNIPVLTTFHDLGEYHIKNKYSFARMIFRKHICIPRSVKRSNKFTSVSIFTANDMERILNIPNDKIKVIYNGSTPHSYNQLETNDVVLNKWGLQKKQYIFTPGRTDYIGKGLDILLEAFKEIYAINPNIKLVMVGPEGEGHDLLLKSLSKDNDFSSNISYLGRVSENELISLYSNCLTTVIASRFEGFGFPILEAMAFNVPIICSDAGSLPEVAGDAAIIFKSGDTKNLSDSIKKILKLDPAQIDLFKAKGKKRLLNFTWEKCAKEMYDVFQNVCKEA